MQVIFFLYVCVCVCFLFDHNTDQLKLHSAAFTFVYLVNLQALQSQQINYCRLGDDKNVNAIRDILLLPFAYIFFFHRNINSFFFSIPQSERICPADQGRSFFFLHFIFASSFSSSNSHKINRETTTKMPVKIIS